MLLKIYVVCSIIVIFVIIIDIVLVAFVGFIFFVSFSSFVGLIRVIIYLLINCRLRTLVPLCIEIILLILCVALVLRSICLVMTFITCVAMSSGLCACAMREVAVLGWLLIGTGISLLGFESE